MPAAPSEPTLAPRRTRRAVALAATIGVLAGGAAAGLAVNRFSGSSSAHAERPSAAAAAPATGFEASLVTGAKADVADLIDQVMPGVVSITVKGPGGQGAGTGFVISADGQIATNAHVVGDADTIDVAFNDGSTATAKVVGVDRTDDLAVIHVDRRGLHALELGSSKLLRVGVPVVAIGNALALTGSPTATEGIISSLDRSIDTDNGEHLAHLLQTDAAINPGNSGGPLLTLDGKVVGINSAGSKNAQNVGFAIAVDTAKPVITQLEAGKTVTKPFLGVSTATVDPTVARQNGLAVDHGALITDVSAQSAAAAAGLQPGDVITAANGTTLTDEAGLRDVIRSTGAGGTLHLRVDRNGTTLELSAVLSTHAA